MCVHGSVQQCECFPNMSLECLLYPIQYLFLAPHISVPIDSSDSRQDNNRTTLPLSFSPPLLLPSPRGTTQGWRDENREIRGRRAKGGGNDHHMLLPYPESLCRKDGGARKVRRGGKLERNEQEPTSGRCEFCEIWG